MKVATPNRLDSLVLKNTLDAPCKITVTRHNGEKKPLEETVVVAAGDSHVFEEKEIDMGGWKAVSAILSVEVKNEGEDKKSRLEAAHSPLVQGIVKSLALSISGGEGGVLKLE